MLVLFRIILKIDCPLILTHAGTSVFFQLSGLDLKVPNIFKFLRTISLVATSLIAFHLFLFSAGGLLISAAHFGAYVYGTDIDYNTIHGLGMLNISKLLYCNHSAFKYHLKLVVVD